MSDHYIWSTEKELRFLARLGQHTKSKEHMRSDLLKNYLYSMEKRVRWDGIDPDIIRTYIKVELMSLGESK